MPRVTEVAVEMPKRSTASSFCNRKKPMASVAISLEGGGVRDIVVPVKAARLIDDAALVSKGELNDVFDAIHSIELKSCFTLLTDMLSRRDYSCAEMREKLIRYGFTGADIESCIAKACAARYLDDARFAKYFIDERKRRGWGRVKIECELRARGVDPAGLDGYPAEFFDEEDDFERACQLANKRSIPETNAFQKLVRYLLSKGFDYGTASRAVRKRLNDACLNHDLENFD